MPVFQVDTVCRDHAHICGHADLRQGASSRPFACLITTDLNSWPVEFLPGTSADPGQISEIQDLHSLTSGPSSLDLCLSVLLGLALCSCPHWVRKLSLGSIGQWYHDGGPAQIGHSLAVSIDSICPIPARCFIQPVCPADDIVPYYCLRVNASLRRKPQFTPDVIAARGPPPACKVDKPDLS